MIIIAQTGRIPTHLLKQARYQKDLAILDAPVDGTAQQLAAHTADSVVTPAQLSIVIVPQNQSVEVGAILENKDIGFMHSGQLVTIKVETFTYTKCGTLDGTVVSVSRDAIEDEKRGLIDLQQQDPPGPRPPEHQRPKHQAVTWHGGNGGSKEPPASSDRVLPEFAEVAY